MYAVSKFLIAALLGCLLVSPAVHADYTGSLTSEDGGLVGTGAWIDKFLLPPDEQSAWTPVTLSWHVYQNPDQTWHFSYDVSVYRFSVSHTIVEVSEAFEMEDLLNPQGPFEEVYLSTHNPGPGNPGIPSSIRGLKFEDMEGTTFRISFDSTRVPVWGNFYMKDGRFGDEWNAAWNAGFELGTPDPDIPISSGSWNNYVLVPDSILVPDDVIPEPASMLALGSGFGLLLARRKIRRG